MDPYQRGVEDDLTIAGELVWTVPGLDEYAKADVFDRITTQLLQTRAQRLGA